MVRGEWRLVKKGDSGNGEQAVAADDPVHRVQDRPLVVSARGVRVPEQAGDDVAQEYDDGGHVKELEQQIHRGGNPVEVLAAMQLRCVRNRLLLGKLSNEYALILGQVAFFVRLIRDNEPSLGIDTQDWPIQPNAPYAPGIALLQSPGLVKNLSGLGKVDRRVLCPCR